MPDLTIQPNGANCSLDMDYPNANDAGGTGSVTVNASKRMLLRFDFSSLPAGAVISAAVLSIYEGGGGGTGAVSCYEITQPGWVEAQATANIYSTGNSWATQGGDYTVTNGGSIAALSGGNNNITITDLIKHCQSSHSEMANLILIRGSGAGFYLVATRQNATESRRPKLVITYTVPTNRANGMLF
jgi:hypothetical protein